MNSVSKLWPWIRCLLFRQDPEKAHEMALRMISCAGKLGFFNQEMTIAHPSRYLFGIEFKNPVGLAAGFDKNATFLRWLPAFGFGFAEIGTVTPKPQPGNSKPRLFRDTARENLFNRMGFNNNGSQEIALRLEKTKKYLPQSFKVGVNLGKNRDTPLAEAHSDYASALKPFMGLVDFAVINISSPNTPGLRSLQSTESVKRILDSVQTVAHLQNPTLPILLKLAPELSEANYGELISEEGNFGHHGWVLTNTVSGCRWAQSPNGPGLEGGWSGRTLKFAARSVLEFFKLHSKLPLVSVGGIDSPEEILVRQSMGANLFELYSGWVFQGPALVPALVESLQSRELSRN
jgi:dihydroorotate dehydrogenase